MQYDDTAIKLLEALDAGWALLNTGYRVEAFNSKFQDVIPPQNQIRNQVITDILPEMIGFEQILHALQTGDKKHFTVPQVAKEVHSGQIKYFNLVLLNTHHPISPLLLALIDETEYAVILQKLQQQSFEIRLIRSLMNERQATVAAGMIGLSEPMQQLKTMIEKLARIPSSTVLIQGETGTGKSLVARMIHLATDESERPFVEFNCAAVPESLLESELFGHEKGAFTHAVVLKKGLLEEADGGTLFLDEIGDIHANLQAKLLTVLDTRKFRRLGSTKEISTQFRLIAATHRNLKSMVKEGLFREDLYYRIQVITLNCPPLRAMGKDVIEIAEHFIQVYSKEFAKSISGLTLEAKQWLTDYHWPGNVRELRNVIERAMIFAEGNSLGLSDLHVHTGESEPVRSLPDNLNDGLSFADLEKQLLKRALDKANGNQSRAARSLQMSRDAFRYRLEKYHLLG